MNKFEMSVITDEDDFFSYQFEAKTDLQALKYFQAACEQSNVRGQWVSFAGRRIDEA